MIKLRKSFKREIKNITKSVVNGRLSHMLTAAWKSDEEAFFFFVLLFSSKLSRSLSYRCRLLPCNCRI